MFNTDSLQIIPGNNPILREKSKEIANPKDPAVANLVKQMITTLRLNHGVGLAAPQIGETVRLFIVEVDYELHVFINPVIKSAGRDKITMEEGCLSFPGIFKPVERSKKITVSYYDLEGKKKSLKARGMLARVVQHEYDHLEGVLFIDREKK